MIFYVCNVFRSGVQVGAWATSQAVGYDGIISGMGEIRVGLGDGNVVPASSVEMKVLRSAAVDALLGVLAEAFKLEYRISVSIDGVLYPVGTYFHASELPVSDAQSYTLFLQDAVSRIGSTAITPTLADIVLAGDISTNPLFGRLDQLCYLRGSESTPTRIAFGTDQLDLGAPIWRKSGAPGYWLFPPSEVPMGAIHFVSHVQLDNGTGSATASPLEMFAFDGGVNLPAQYNTIAGLIASFTVTTVPVLKGGRTWFVVIVSVPFFAANWIFIPSANSPNQTEEENRPLLSVDFQILTNAQITAKYTATEADLGQTGLINQLLSAGPYSMTWERISEVSSADGASAIYDLLQLCDTAVEVDDDSLLRSQAVARNIAGVATGSARAALLQVAAASGVSICASREGRIQFVAPTNETPVTLTRIGDVSFYWRETGGRGAAFCGVRLVNHKKTPTTSEADGGTVMLTDSAMFLAGIRNVLFEFDCSLIPLDLQQNAAAVLSYLGVTSDGARLVRVSVPIRDAATLRVGDNIQFTFLPYVGATPEVITASIESMVFGALKDGDGSVELYGVFNDLDLAPYILPGERLQSIMPALQYALTGSTRDPEFQDGATYWTYSGTHWKTAGAALLSSDLGEVQVWIRYNDIFNRIVYAPGTLSFDVTDGVIVTRGPDTLEAVTTTLRGLDKYDILASQQDALTWPASILAPSALGLSESFSTIQNATICNAIGLSPGALSGLVWTFVDDFTIQTPSALTGFFDTAGWAAVVDGVGYEISAVIAGGVFSPGYISISFTSAPTWRVGAAGFSGLQFAPISPVGLDTGALTDPDGTGSPSGPRLLG